MKFLYGDSKGQIKGELVFVLKMFSNSIRLDDKLRREIRKFIYLERRIKDLITESKIIQFGVISMEKSKSKVKEENRS